MDYDATTIAATYDAARGLRPEALVQWLDLVAAHAPPAPRLILDVGCGTGRFTHPLAERFPALVVGIDPSATMLDAARCKDSSGRTEFRQAPAERLPVDDGSADVVFMSMMLHHLDDRPRAAAECRRALGSGGRVCVRNTTRDSLYPHRQFFPGFQAIVDDQLPSRDEVVALFEAAGLRLQAYQVVEARLARSWGEFADKLALRADSFIVRLPKDEFDDGMAALRARARQSDGTERIVDHIHFFVFRARDES